jgi:chromosome segregation ATPase
VGALPEVVNSIYGLALKAQSVETALGGTNPIDRLTDEIKQLEAQINATNDEFQKSQYYAALDGKLQQMQNLTDTTVAMRRWDSQIENALSTLDTLLSQVLRIKSSEVLSYSGATDELSNSLKREVDSLKATAEAMDNVYGWK